MEYPRQTASGITIAARNGQLQHEVTHNTRLVEPVLSFTHPRIIAISYDGLLTRWVFKKRSNLRGLSAFCYDIFGEIVDISCFTSFFFPRETKRGWFLE